MSQINAINVSLLQQVQQRYGGSGSSLNATKTFSSQNASIRIHEDTPKIVQDKFPEKILCFQSVEPDIQDAANPRWERTQVLGRSENYLTYMGGDNRTISFVLNFLASVEQGDRGEFDQAMRAVLWLRSLQYPTYQDGICLPPPLLHLVFGRLFSQRGVLERCDVTYGRPFSELDNTQSTLAYPIHARASLVFTCTNRTPRQASDVVPQPGQTLYPVR